MSARQKRHKPKTDWAENDKGRAVAVYKSTGNLAKTSRITGIPERTIHFWVKQEWWAEKLNQLRAEDTAELEEAHTDIAKMATGVVKERLSNGDFILTRDGDLIRKPVSARDAAVIGAIAVDKRKALSEEPQRVAELGTAERLLKLVEQFARFANAKEIKGVLSDSKDLERIPSEIGIGEEEPLEAEFIEEPSSEETGADRILQAQEEMK